MNKYNEILVYCSFVLGVVIFASQSFLACVD